MTDITNLISASTLRLRTRSAYFATLALFAPIVPSTTIERAATDGQQVFINPNYFATLSPRDQDRALLHQVLHAALLHIPRRGKRDPRLWNTACDIVVQGIAAQIEGIGVAEHALRDPELEQLSVEEVYELLQRQPDRYPLTDEIDLIVQEADRSGMHGVGGAEQETRGTGRNAILESHWRNALHQADMLALMVAQGSLPTGVQRELSVLDAAKLDWRSHLWRYLVQTPTDFEGFDRRFIGRGLYLDALAGETVHVFVGVDTSGSIDETHLDLLMSEVRGILRAYPHINCQLFYVDAEAHGPYHVMPDNEIPPPIGGGGTDFRPFFVAVEHELRPTTPSVAIYLTDGYGTFPSLQPEIPVLWIVVAGGLASDAFPWGEVVRMIAD